MPGAEVRIIQSQVIKAIIIQAMVQSGVVMTGNADRIEAGAEIAVNEILEEMKKDPRRGATARGPITKNYLQP